MDGQPSVPESPPLPRYICGYWGKARPETPGALLYHPLAYHQLDVAAVLAELLGVDARLRGTLRALAGARDEAVTALWLFAAALHDLGKFARSFQTLVPEVARMLTGHDGVEPYVVRHDAMGFAYFVDELAVELADNEAFQIRLDGRCLRDEDELRDLLTPLFSASTGHHGRPPEPARARRFFDRTASEDARRFARELLGVLGQINVELSSRTSFDEQLSRVSWIFAGALIVADWLGSNQAYFPYEPANHTIADYWTLARARARVAVAAAGLKPCSVATARSMSELFPHIERATPLQEAASSLALEQGGTLTILEDATGAGKTEAGLRLAHRLMAAGRADGIYVALPTQATASGMYRRVAGVFERLYEQSGRPSLVLAHSAKHLFGMALAETPTDAPYQKDELSASVHCSSWLADSRKKSLLANVGVGTIDQALVSILPANHSPLRLLGLARKVLICDEVHAYDEYTTHLLTRLLAFHAAFGGSAILLSATLPLSLRARFIRAFELGRLEEQDEPAESPSCSAFPLMTHVGRGRLHEVPIDSRPGMGKTTPTGFLMKRAQAVDVLVQAAKRGQCAAWIRNTVDDAKEAYKELATRLGAGQVQLFHARFVMGHRLQVEDDVLVRFGPASGPTRRSGRVLVATQVVEQSLDLDFDVMVTDLAPIDLVLQRAGRLRRHRRCPDGTRTDGPDLRGDSMLHILAPPWSPDPSAGW